MKEQVSLAGSKTGKGTRMLNDGQGAPVSFIRHALS